MPAKMKTHSGAKKRFRKTASGKWKYRKSHRAHLLTGRRTKRKRQLRSDGFIDESHAHQIKALLPYA